MSGQEKGIFTVHVGADGDRSGSALARALVQTRGRGAARIVVHGGRYYDVSLELGSQESGLTIEAAPGERPVLCGGRAVSGWEREGDSFISAALPGVSEGTWDFRTLIVNGEFRPRARLPREGTFKCLDVFNGHWMSSTAGGWDRKPTEAELTTLTYRPEDLGSWLDVRNAEVTVFHEWDESLVGVASNDAAAHRLRLSSPTGHPPGAWPHQDKAGAYIVWNVREGMTAPGQWYLDRTRGRLVYWPLPGEDPERLDAIAPSVTRIIRIADAQAITIRGLALTATTTPLRAAGFGACNLDGAISVGGGVRDVLLYDLDIENVGGHAVRARAEEKGQEVARVRVERSCIRSAGGSAVQMRGRECAVTDCDVRGVGRVFPSALGITVSGTDCEISHNEISDTSYTALHGGGPGTCFECNIIRDFMTVLDDGAAIYIFGGDHTTYRGNVAIGSSGRLAHAYYLDEQSHDCVVEGNLAVNTRWPSHNHMAHDCTIQDNVFVDEGDMRLTFMRCRDFTFRRNVCRGGGKILITGINVLVDMPANVFYSEVGVVEGETCLEYRGENRGPVELCGGSVCADPRFVDAASGDYDFATDSPARALGIEPIDTRRAGIRRGCTDDAAG